MEGERVGGGKGSGKGNTEGSAVVGVCAVWGVGGGCWFGKENCASPPFIPVAGRDPRAACRNMEEEFTQRDVIQL